MTDEPLPSAEVAAAASRRARRSSASFSARALAAAARRRCGPATASIASAAARRIALAFCSATAEGERLAKLMLTLCAFPPPPPPPLVLLPPRLLLARLLVRLSVADGRRWSLLPLGGLKPPAASADRLSALSAASASSAASACSSSAASASAAASATSAAPSRAVALRCASANSATTARLASIVGSGAVSPAASGRLLLASFEVTSDSAAGADAAAEVAAAAAAASVAATTGRQYAPHPTALRQRTRTRYAVAQGKPTRTSAAADPVRAAELTTLPIIPPSSFSSSSSSRATAARSATETQRLPPSVLLRALLPPASPLPPEGARLSCSWYFVTGDPLGRARPQRTRSDAEECAAAKSAGGTAGTVAGVRKASAAMLGGAPLSTPPAPVQRPQPAAFAARQRTAYVVAGLSPSIIALHAYVTTYAPPPTPGGSTQAEPAPCPSPSPPPGAASGDTCSLPSPRPTPRPRMACAPAAMASAGTTIDCVRMRRRRRRSTLCCACPHPVAPSRRPCGDAIATPSAVTSWSSRVSWPAASIATPVAIDSAASNAQHAAPDEIATPGGIGRHCSS